jgi:hypothetical protein
MIDWKEIVKVIQQQLGLGECLRSKEPCSEKGLEKMEARKVCFYDLGAVLKIPQACCDKAFGLELQRQGPSLPVVKLSPRISTIQNTGILRTRG